MFKKRITALALVAILAVGGTSISSFAAEVSKPTEPQRPAISFDHAGGSGAFAENGRDFAGMQALKAQLEEKGLSLEEAKTNFAEMLNQFAQAKGISVEETQQMIADLRANGMTLEGISTIKADLEEKGLTLEEAKANFAIKLAAFAEEAGLSIEEAQAKVNEMKESGRTFEGLKMAKDQANNVQPA